MTENVAELFLGSLRERILWKRDETFNSIAKGYVEYIQQKFTSPIVVFDGYNAGPGTKDTANLRPTKALVGPKVTFVVGMPLKT